MENKTPFHILPTIVIAQFCCTSLWFAGNAVMNDLVQAFNLPNNALGHLTSVIQLGFITGTLVFALLMIADRFSPSRVFFISALLGSVANLGIAWGDNSFTSLLSLRFITGFFLAGIYPVGMKIAADYYKAGLGKSLGWLVGALVFGTAFPHLLQVFSGALEWTIVIYITSALALLGGGMILLLVPSGPYRKAGTQVDLTAWFKVFKDKKFRTAAFGYFGHMWELYAFWTFVPFILTTFGGDALNVPLYAFLVIGMGGVACVIGGQLAFTFGTQKIATVALSLSCICCLISPLIFFLSSPMILVAFLLFWGAVVVMDSPLFSTLVAQNAPPKIKGTALTIVNCLGFAITVLSIQFLTQLMDTVSPMWLLAILAMGPILSLPGLIRGLKKVA